MVGSRKLSSLKVPQSTEGQKDREGWWGKKKTKDDKPRHEAGNFISLRYHHRP